ncbi:MAG: DNA/RNA nuclease SfsA, partial [Anaerovoracaceae bacterium]
MKYENICRGNFIDRPNRFIAEVVVDGQKVRAHVKNTGRCRELLIPGAEVFLEDHVLRMGSRKLRYSLIGVKKGEKMV